MRVKMALKKMESAGGTLAQRVNVTKRDGTSAMHAASEKGHTEVIQMLLSLGAEPDSTDCYGSAPLALACRTGQPDAASILLQASANPDRQSHVGFSPLMRACSERTPEHEACIRVLLEHGADVTIRRAADTGESALILACRVGNTPAVKLLLASPRLATGENAQDPLDCPSSSAALGGALANALTDACTHAYVDCARALLDAGAKYDGFGRYELTPLMAAACAHSLSCARAWRGWQASRHRAAAPLARSPRAGARRDCEASPRSHGAPL